jgi:hypothetical protein
MRSAFPALVLRLAAVVVAAALLSALSYAIVSMGVRPLDGVEGEVLYEAHRLRASLALYTDPIVGAFDEGPVPARFYVLYPPVWAWLLSLLPAKSAPLVGRVIACGAWFGLLAAVVLRSPRERRGPVTTAAAAFVGGVYTLTLYGAAARPDALAIALAGAGLLRAVEKKGLDGWVGALFALAAWTKPNVLGIAAGAMAAGAWLDRRAALRTALGAILASAAMATVLHMASAGAWLEHLVRATGQPMSLALWVQQVPPRLQFLGAPLAFAAWAGWRSRADPAMRIALGALAVSLAWTLVSLAKIGSATNYWMEPAIAALVIVSRAPLALPARPWARAALAAGALLQALWTGVATVRSSFEAIQEAKVHAELLRNARALCNAGADEIVMADEPGLELMLDGRITTTPFQMTHLARRGKYPLGPWARDVTRPEVRCLLMEDDLIDRPPNEVNVEHDRFGPELRAVLRARFTEVTEQGGWRLYRVRDDRTN